MTGGQSDLRCGTRKGEGSKGRRKLAYRQRVALRGKGSRRDTHRETDPKGGINLFIIYFCKPPLPPSQYIEACVLSHSRVEYYATTRDLKPPPLAQTPPTWCDLWRVRDGGCTYVSYIHTYIRRNHFGNFAGLRGINNTARGPGRSVQPFKRSKKNIRMTSN